MPKSSAATGLLNQISGTSMKWLSQSVARSIGFSAPFRATVTFWIFLYSHAVIQRQQTVSFANCSSNTANRASLLPTNWEAIGPSSGDLHLVSTIVHTRDWITERKFRIDPHGGGRRSWGGSNHPTKRNAFFLCIVRSKQSTALTATNHPPAYRQSCSDAHSIWEDITCKLKPA